MEKREKKVLLFVILLVAIIGLIAIFEILGLLLAIPLSTLLIIQTNKIKDIDVKVLRANTISATIFFLGIGIQIILRTTNFIVYKIGFKEINPIWIYLHEFSLLLLGFSIIVFLKKLFSAVKIEENKTKKIIIIMGISILILSILFVLISSAVQLIFL